MNDIMNKQLEFYILDSDNKKIILDVEEVYIEYTNHKKLVINTKNPFKGQKLFINYVGSSERYKRGVHVVFGIHACNLITINVETFANNSQSDIERFIPSQLYIKDNSGNQIEIEQKKIYIEYSINKNISIEILEFKDLSPELSFRSFYGLKEYEKPEEGLDTAFIVSPHAANCISIGISD